MSYKPNSQSSIANQNDLEYFKFEGKFVALALIHGECINVHFTTAFCKQILHRKPKFKDLQDFDEKLYQGLSWIQENDAKQSDFVFNYGIDFFGEYKEIELKENGSEIAVTNDNKKEYIDFVEATGAEYVCSWGFWLIFRKETEQGDFKLYTDKESRIKLYQRIRFLFLAFALLELGLCIFNSYNVWDASGGFLASGSWGFWRDGGFLLAIVPVAACLAACSLFFMAARLTRKIHHLKQEKFFP